MKILSILFLSIGFVGTAWAGPQAQAPGPGMTAGVIGMTLAGGVVYLIKRRNRS